MEIWKIGLAAVAGYLLGSISVAIVACRRLYGTDVREHGSGNAGATNVARVFGMKAGVITFVGDLQKCGSFASGYMALRGSRTLCRSMRMPGGALLARVFRVSRRQRGYGQRSGCAFAGSTLVPHPRCGVFYCLLLFAHGFHLLDFGGDCLSAYHAAFA